MRKIYFTLILTWCMLLTACSRPTIENTEAAEGIALLAAGTSLAEETVESLSDINIAERYGLNPSDIEEGYVITSSENGKPDKIILVKGKDRTSVENIEKSLSNVLINLTSTYKDYPEESKKIENHLFKTRDTLTLLAVCDNSKDLEEVFNSFS
ncbi:MAG: DUF4358 domain-containing protein [Eubacterium sp.]|nr:DUF4358 domain-containing protein [Eubacterium sp.]